jgi:hypothetical protein
VHGSGISHIPMDMESEQVGIIWVQPIFNKIKRPEGLKDGQIKTFGTVN